MDCITVIVPVYKVEKYLDQCVESIVNQTYRNLEIILVDDGSPDRCPQMCDEWAKKDERIKVIHQRNAGLGPARNSGMAIATGEYVAFVDSDDWVKPEMYQRLYEAAEGCEADIVVSGHRDVAEGKVLVTKVHPLAGSKLTEEEDIRSVRNRLFGHAPWDREVEAFPMSVWMSLYRRSMLQNAGLTFMEILSEDTIFNLSAYLLAKTIVFTDGTDYCYRKENQVSITQSFSERKMYRFQEFLTELTRKAQEENCEECTLRAKRMGIDCCRLYVGAVADSNLVLKEKKEAIKRFVEKKEVKCCWEGYPVAKLPIQQRVFHELIMARCYGMVLLLAWIRKNVKKIGWV